MRRHLPDVMRQRGFALVVTISLMLLLTVVAVGLLSLSAVTMRSTGQQLAVAEARANARMALMIAIGELQKQLGPDQRVTASGAVLSTDTVRHPHWTGVWDSWHAGPATPNTSNPDEPSDHQTIPGSSTLGQGMHPTYVAQRKDHFRSWLVSLDTDEINDVTSAQSLALTGSTMPDKDATAVKLVAEGSLGAASEQDHVSARLIGVQAGATAKVTGSTTGTLGGRYAWWVGDESQKARIMSDSYEKSGTTLTLAQRVFRHQAPASTGTTTVKGLENIKDDQQLKDLPSLGTLDLVGGATGKPSKNFHDVTAFSSQILTNVRSGGLKRDLTTLLERPISTTETSDDFMLYRFDNAGQERVPIQDLAAFYQLYDSTRDPNKTKGIRYSSSQTTPPGDPALQNDTLLPNGIQATAPDFYASRSTSSFLREYTSLYRSPVPIKIQMVLAASAEVLDASANPPTYNLRLGLAPAVTFWNPNNVPVVMNLGDPAFYAQQMRFSYVPFMITWNKNSGSFTCPVSLSYAAMGGNTNTGQPGWASGGQYIKASIFDMYFSGNPYPIVFEPGEARVFSYQWQAGNFQFRKDQNDVYLPAQLACYGWKSQFLQMPCSAWPATNPNVKNNLLVINPSDTLSFTITTEKDNNVSYTAFQETPGAGMSFMMIQKIFQSRPTAQWGLRNYQLCSRTGAGTTTVDFNDGLIKKGYPTGSGTIGADVPIANMIASPGTWQALLQFAVMAGSEVNENIAGHFGGRKFASRPFLHAPAMAPPMIDNDDGASLYNSGWNWWVEPINSVDQAEVGVADTTRGRGYFGGGTTSTFGSTHVIQQEIPVVPPMSIAALSHAHLGGFSLAGASPDMNNAIVTAGGYAGLSPHTLQAIGNSYAHPLIPADKAYTSISQTFNTANGPKSRTLADHSYLANKALWDEYFFSSLAPAPTGVQVFGSDAGRTAEAAADDFFFKDMPTPLPNRRLLAYTDNFDKAQLSQLFQKAQTFNGGLADQIAAHLMVDGAFNVNSTSVEAWKVFLSSLKGKPVAYLDPAKALTAGVSLDQVTPDGTPVGPSSLPNGKPTTGGGNDPSEATQWANWRQLTDAEIEQLATALVKQVKLRGPFLSLSEFVNRRLDSSNEDLSVKGALQAALDDPSVSINSGFRSAARQFSAAEISSVNTAFKKALEGPVAYGSAAYVDQADILRNFAEQLTPRGDTFVIRAYGDALDAKGNVTARAWCEAVVQRVLDYLDPSDLALLKPADLTANANKIFGRKLKLVSFRFLGRAEI